MSKMMGSILAALLALQAGLATLTFSDEHRVAITLAVTVAIVGLTFYLKQPE